MLIHALVATYLNWGIGFDYPGNGSYSDVQNYSIGQTRKLDSNFQWFYEGGYWKDQGDYNGAKPSFFGVSGVGLDLNMRDKYASYSIGPSVISNTDTLLGSHFELYHKLSFGFRDSNKRIGIFIKHLSDAGMSKVNYGRQFVGLEVQF